MAELVQRPMNRVDVLRNKACPYCGNVFDSGLEPTEDHVIARNFVPRGSITGWNVKLNACRRCNGEKGALEDDIGLITMLPDVGGNYRHPDPRLPSEVKRRAMKTGSRQTGKAVARSWVELKDAGSIGPVEFTVTSVSPPRIAEERAFRLAEFQYLGFCSFLTYDAERREGGHLGTFAPLLSAPRYDWGNAQMRWFMDETRSWDLSLHALAADDFFKVVIRRHPEDKTVWCWAIEWNHSTRVVGFSGLTTDIEDVWSGAPDLVPDAAYPIPGGGVRTRRKQVALAPKDDDLFNL